MCAGTDAQVITKLPVVAVVSASQVGFAESRNFVVFVAAIGELLMQRGLHVGKLVIIG